MRRRVQVSCRVLRRLSTSYCFARLEIAQIDAAAATQLDLNKYCIPPSTPLLTRQPLPWLPRTELYNWPATTVAYLPDMVDEICNATTPAVGWS